ncbi:hypothetical protein JTB14_030943 [Gonioctena quinquepunctata]|nr:hypothetical protein JTB14_030943 [Gonioctena quinquepunctata]
MPAPPPPPPMTSGVTPSPVFKQPKKGANERDALLSSIRKGAKLKKTVTIDKSAPVIPGASNKNSLKSNIRNDSAPPSNMISPMKNNFGSIQMELKKQLANDSRNRGPPPPAPMSNRNMVPEINIPRQPFIHKEINTNGVHHQSQLSLNTNSNLAINPSMLHRKTKSNANLSSIEISEDRNGYTSKPVINHGKPNLAPKPPVLSSKPLGLQIKQNKPVSRTHSLKSPRSPSPQSPEGNAMKFGTVRHMSSIIGQSLANSSMHQVRSRPALNGRPSAPPPLVPTHQTPNHQPSPSQPPPPPPPKSIVKHPDRAPPPPPPISTIPQAPSHVPPPPPHKTQLNRPPIPVPQENNNNINPPPPPPRHSSMRDTSTHAKVNLDEKFKNMFQPINSFPQPPPFRNISKLYNKLGPITKSGFVN